MGYVTPWNGHGYDVAKTFGDKFDIISPVWLQIQPSNSGSAKPYVIGGTHDVDKRWVSDVKKKGTLVLPRVLFDKVVNNRQRYTLPPLKYGKNITGPVK